MNAFYETEQNRTFWAGRNTVHIFGVLCLFTDQQTNKEKVVLQQHANITKKTFKPTQQVTRVTYGLRVRHTILDLAETFTTSQDRLTDLSQFSCKITPC